MNEILVESGSRLNGALLRAGLVDELVLYFAPHLLGDTARGMFDLRELTGLDQRVALRVCGCAPHRAGSARDRALAQPGL